jgi:hypothetical protein
MYPDVLVTRRPLAPNDDRLSDPTVAVEVLSPASETFDRIYKWREYQGIASLRQYVLIEQKERRIEVWPRTAAGPGHRRALDAARPFRSRRPSRPAAADPGLIGRRALPTRRRLTNAGP